MMHVAIGKASSTGTPHRLTVRPASVGPSTPGTAAGHQPVEALRYGELRDQQCRIPVYPAYRLSARVVLRGWTAALAGHGCAELFAEWPQTGHKVTKQEKG